MAKEPGDAAESIIDKMIGSVEAGIGFVPLIGSGISVQSGIPTGDDLVAELFTQIKRAAEGKWFRDQPDWSIGGRSSKEERGAWVQTTLEKVAAAISASSAMTADLKIRLHAVLASFDWVAALDFLARVEKPSARSPLPPHIATVIDDFFNHLTDGKYPNFAHNMLAHLATRLRIRTLLTTNFDDLVEQAFERLHIALKTLPVHLHASLPSAQLILRSRSLVKLHGTGYGLRANDSLNMRPTLDDIDAFNGYFADSLPCKDKRPPAKCALVMGFSGSDGRIMSLLANAMARHPDMQIFWLRHKPSATGENDVADRLLSRLSDLTRHNPDDIRRRVHVDDVSDLGLFLYDLYQRLHHALPPAGARYSAISRVPALVKVIANEQGAATNPEKESEKIREAVDSGRRVIPVRGDHGVTRVAAIAFEEKRSECECLWFDMSQFRNFKDFRVALLETIASKTGQSMAAHLPPDSRVNIEFRPHLEAIAMKASRPFLVFVNGREGLGTCGGWACDVKPVESVTQKEFWDGFTELAGDDGCIRFVVLCRNEEDPEAGAALTAPPDRESVILEAIQDSTGDTIVTAVMNWLIASDKAASDWRVWRFVYALTLFRRSRPIAALSSWGILKAINPGHSNIGVDNDYERAESGRTIIGELAKMDAIRLKDGGFVWMYDGVRRKLKKALEDGFLTIAENLSVEAVIRQGLADWYAKLFAASSDPLAANESIFHRLCQCQAALEIPSPVDCDTRDMDPRNLVRTGLQQAIHMIETSRSAILGRGYLDNAQELIEVVGDLQKKISTNRSGSKSAELAHELHRRVVLLVGDLFRRNGDYAGAFEIYQKSTKCLTRQPARSLVDDPIPEILLRAISLTGYRKYDDAEHELRGILLSDLKLKIPQEAATDPQSAEARIGQMRKNAEIFASAATEEQLLLAVKALARLMAVQLLQAQRDVHGAPTPKTAPMLQNGEVSYIGATTLLRFVSNVRFIHRYDAKLRTMYGVLLGNLDCPYEAHRRLNEAVACLELEPSRDKSVGLAIIALRRAEVYLRQAAKAGETCWNALAHVEDAQESLHTARRHLSGHRSYTWWWGLYYELELAAIHRHKLILTNPEISKPSENVVPQARAIFGEAQTVVANDTARLKRLLGLLEAIDADAPKLKLYKEAIAALAKRISQLSNGAGTSP